AVFAGPFEVAAGSRHDRHLLRLGKLGFRPHEDRRARACRRCDVRDGLRHVLQQPAGAGRPHRPILRMDLQRPPFAAPAPHTGALANKYALVNSSGIRGMGMWALGYDGGASELWGELSTYFSCPASINVAGTQSTTEFKVQVSAGSCGVKSFDVQQFDGTLNTGWYSLKPSSPSSGSAQVIVDGFPGSTYQLRARAHSTACVTTSWSELPIGVA